MLPKPWFRKLREPRLLKKLLVMVLVNVLLFYGLSTFILRDGEINWGLIYLTYKTELARKIQGPKIVIIGDSGALYGFNSQTITEKTGIETVNLAVSGGFSLQFNFDYAKPLLNPGDIVILSLPTNVIGDANPFGFKYDYHYFRLYDRAKLLSFSMMDLLKFPWETNLLDSLTTTITYVSRLVFKGHYTPDELTSRGDYAACTTPYSGPLEAFVANGEQLTNTASWKLIQKYRDEFKERGIDFYFAWGARLNMPEYKSEAWNQFMDGIETSIDQSGIKTLGDIREFLYDSSSFCNSPFHLNFEGAKVRSLQVAANLNKRLGKTPIIKASLP